jgi:hypothetical protein
VKILFAGPSLYGAEYDAGDVVIRGPAQMGDIERAIADGAHTVGLIDGHYQQVGAVWHKEILFALSSGVTVFGAASMGALRAAECEPFGMIPVGAIATRYCSGELVDDADVALTNGPAELGFPPLTEPMVDVDATVAHLLAEGLVSPEDARLIAANARSIFFADRTIEAIFDHLSGPNLAAIYTENRVSQKTRDALELLEIMKLWDASERPGTPGFRLANSPFWTSRSSAVTPL